MPCCKISDCAQMSKTIIAVRHFGLGGRKSLETAVIKAYHRKSGKSKYDRKLTELDVETTRVRSRVNGVLYI